MKKYIGLTLALLVLFSAGTPVFATGNTKNENNGWKGGLIGTLFKNAAATTNVHYADHWEAHGTITAIDGNTLTVSAKSKNSDPRVYTVDSSKATILYRGTTGSIDQLKVGDSVVVDGTVTATTGNTTLISATTISAALSVPGAAVHDIVRGTVGKVTKVNGTTITMDAHPEPKNGNKTTYTVKTDHATIIKNTDTVSLATIHEGDTILVTGSVNDATISANKIYVWDNAVVGNVFPGVKNNGQPIIYGTITAINDDTVTVTSKDKEAYRVDTSDAQITFPKKTSTTHSSLSVGDTVLIQGSIDGSHVRATAIIDQPVNTAIQAHANLFAKIGSFLRGFFK
jgi:hypothetical protein